MPTIKMPQAGRSVQSGTVRRWLKKPGDKIEKGDILVELDTEEGILQVETPLPGWLGQILLTDGQTAAVQSALAVIEEKEPKGEVPDIRAPKPNAQAAASPPTGSPAPQSGTRPGEAPGTGPPARTAGNAAAGKVIPILMPKAGQSMEEGTILQWRVQAGMLIRKGDVILEIETDKATMEVEAPESGRLARIVEPEGSVLPVLKPIAYLADNDADVDAYIAAYGADAATQAPQVGQEQAPPARTTPPAAVGAATPTVLEGGRVKASPAARKLAAQRGVDLRTIAGGSGPSGRILSTDVPVGGTAGVRRPLSRMRKAIARSLQQSKQTIPHFYMRLTLSAEPVLSFYQSCKARFRCSLNDVIVQACARAIREFPAFRSRIEGDELLESPSVNIGIAVAVPDGLVVPVVVDADRMSLEQISAQTRQMVEAARSGKVHGMGQGSFTITNLGMVGTEEFAAIINPPDTAILAVGAVRQAAVVKDGAVRAGKVMTVTLSADHRVIDGMLAARFLERLRELLEDPAQLEAGSG
jgi:pyruvate dehydrogenase E2 component (dihydrolipoamide acetyltransferase)